MMREEIWQRHCSTSRPDIFEVGKPKFPIAKMHGRPQPQSFIEERLWLLFTKLDAEGAWLHLPVEDWEGVE